MLLWQYLLGQKIQACSLGIMKFSSNAFYVKTMKDSDLNHVLNILMLLWSHFPGTSQLGYHKFSLNGFYVKTIEYSENDNEWNISMQLWWYFQGRTIQARSLRIMKISLNAFYVKTIKCSDNNNMLNMNCTKAYCICMVL